MYNSHLSDRNFSPLEVGLVVGVVLLVWLSAIVVYCQHRKAVVEIAAASESRGGV